MATREITRRSLLAGGTVALAFAQTKPLTREELEAIPLTSPSQATSQRKQLFDGTTLKGWSGGAQWWSVRDGEIVGKSSEKASTTILFTDEPFSDFRLTLSSRMVESDNHAGVAFWGEPVERGESRFYTRGPLVVFPRPGMWDYIDAKGIRVFRPNTITVGQHDWVSVEVLAQGNRVRCALTGAFGMAWREPDPTRIRKGPIGLQLHAWTGPQEVRYKDVRIETYPREDRLLTVTA
jgi:hypothetical protein